MCPCAALPEAAHVGEAAPMWQQSVALPGADADRSHTPAAVLHRTSTCVLCHIAACHGSLAFCDVRLQLWANLPAAAALHASQQCKALQPAKQPSCLSYLCPGRRLHAGRSSDACAARQQHVPDNLYAQCLWLPARIYGSVIPVLHYCSSLSVERPGKCLAYPDVMSVCSALHFVPAFI